MSRSSVTAAAAGPALAMLAVALLAGCASQPTSSSTDNLEDTVTVFAAASLTESFEEIAEAFEAGHPGVRVALNFGGSSTLATQLAEGAPADVFASASPETMTVAGAMDFATNVLEIAVPAGNPGGVTGLPDFADPALSIALCAAEVPCGAVAQQALAAARVVASVDTFEQDVRAVLTKIELGEVDAGLVYRTDVLAAGAAVRGIAIESAPSTSYPIAVLPTAPHPLAAGAFVAFVLSDAGQAILRKAGFGAP